MEPEIMQELIYINENLKAVVTNQYAMYMELKEAVQELADKKKIDTP